MNPYDEGVDEDYGDESPSSMASHTASNYEGIAGLDMIDDDEHIVAPSAVMPLLPHIGATGQVARYNVRTTPRTSPGSTDSDDYDYASLAELGNMDDIVTAAAAEDFRRAAITAQGGPNSNGPVVPLPPSVLSGVMLQQQQRQQQQQQQPQGNRNQHDQGARLLRLIRECENQPQMRDLMRLIESIETAPSNERVLQDRLDQLNRILQTRRRTDRRDPRNTSVTYSRQIRDLRCRTARVRRALHAYLSRLREHVIDRLRGLHVIRRPMQSPPPPNMKGGKSKTKSKSKKKHMSRNKTIKRR
jgi:hypothetical protein